MLTDNELLVRLSDLATKQAQAESEIIGYLVEVVKREIHLKKAFRSLFEFVRVHLKCSDAAAGRRVAVVKAAAKFPIVLDYLRLQKLNLTSLALAAPHLKPDNCSELLSKLEGLSTREVDKVLAGYCPRKIKRDSIRAVTTSPSVNTDSGAGVEYAHADQTFSGGETLVLGQEEHRQESRVRISFDAPAELAESIERFKEIHAHKLKEGTLAEVLQMALEISLEKTQPEKQSVVQTPKAVKKNTFAKEKKVTNKSEQKTNTPMRNMELQPRRAPAAVRRTVWRRDGAQCTFTDESGKRCSAKSHLQFDHVQPWSLGGSSRDAGNIRILCRAHNLFMARQYFPVQRALHAQIGMRY